MKNLTLYLILIITAVSFYSCDESIESGLNRHLQNADKVKVYYFERGRNTVTDSNMVITVSKPDDVKKIIASIADEAAEDYKCGYSGFMEIYSQNKNILNLEFNVDEGCTHYVFRYRDQIYSKKMTPEGQKLLNQYHPEKK